MKRKIWLLALPAALVVFGSPRAKAGEPVETAQLAYAPNVPPPITRRTPAVVVINLEAQMKDGTLMDGLEAPTQYHFWTFNGHVPGPFIRVRVGDTIEIHLKNPASETMAHSIDLHAVSGPGGGAEATLTQPGQTSVARFKMLYPGLFIYHCAAAPVTDHIANGMYGEILVEPAEGLPKVDREFYVMQSEFFTKEEFNYEGMTTYDPDKGAAEDPTYIVFNGRVGSMMGDDALKAKVGDKIRIFFGNIGPTKISSFHIIGTIFDHVYREGGIDADHNVQTTVVPAGGASMVDFTLREPGVYTMVDHAIFRVIKGAIGQIKAAGAPVPQIYEANAGK